MSTSTVVCPVTTEHGPKKAMILAAGLGTRMRPITESTPKPLIEVYGKPMLDHALDALQRAGVEEVVLNVHYLADQIEDHVQSRRDMKIHISDERAELLDSGGGIANALPMLGEDPFYLLNADSFWIEGFKPNLVRMAEFWQSSEMDILLLLSGMATAVGFGSRGDFTMDADGRLTRRIEHKVAPFAYAGAAILDPSIFDTAPSGAFSLNRQFDEALEKERLFGLRLEGLWLHVGTPDAIHEAEDAIAKSAA
ncbi:MAG: nucleotidyltransferase family protein [Rhizobiaceae bacterium]|nr:nucleotidyltransferase family protein [Rhizobiaceae bacterium]